MIYAAHHIPDNIQRLFSEREKTSADLARELEVSRVFVGKIMAGDKTPSLARMLEIARFFGVTPNDLLGASE
jgi:transcriptional regulator with XRE-family HTH domain